MVDNLLGELPNDLKKEFPYDMENMNLGADKKMNFVFHGNPHGEVVLMLHGNPTWSFYYRHLIKDLKGTYQCLVPDHLGMGLSSRPKDYQYNLENRIADIIKLLDYKSIKSFHLIVHDWGGAIGLGVATRRPEMIKSITILNTAAFTDTFIPWQINLCKAPIIGDFMVRKLNAFAGPATFMASSKKLSDIAKKGLLYPYGSSKNRIAISRFVQDIPMNKSHKSYPTLKNIEENLINLQHKPIKIIWGADDFCFTKHFYYRFKAIFPKASGHLIENTGHYLLEDSPELINPMIRSFLNDSKDQTTC
jgi:cis-3-alkyl-4-acyloxetan-2-one decarboxylase